MQQEFLLTQSSYYHQNFNTAIFFDPFRVYFNTSMESAALNLYYNVQKHFENRVHAKCSFYVLVYPEASLFEAAFGNQEGPVAVAQEGGDFILGLRDIKTLSDSHQEVIDALEEAMLQSASIA